MNDFLKTLAPMLGTAFAGPLGGIAASFLADKLGVQEKTIAAVTEALSTGGMTSEQITSIREAETEFKKWMGDNQIKQDQLVVEDRKSARDMQIATHSRMPAVLTIMVTIGFFSVLGALLAMPELKTNEIVLVMVGQLSAVWGACVAFYVSTTFSSASKNQLLAQANPPK